MSEQSKKDKIEPRKLLGDQELLEMFLKHQIENTKYGGKPMYHYNFTETEKKE